MPCGAYDAVSALASDFCLAVRITACSPHMQPMEVADFYCGAGGLSAGAILSGNKVRVGVDMDSTALRHWAANTSGRAECVEIVPGEGKNLPWPTPTPRTHVHLSPPCTMLSKARAQTTEEERSGGLDELRWCIEEVLRRGYTSFSVENVSTPLTVDVAKEMRSKHCGRLDFLILDAAEYGSPSDRTRLIVSTPAIVKHLKEVPVKRVSVRQAFEAEGLTLPATHIKNNTRARDGSPCVRSVEQSSQTVVGSHPLTWCKRDGTTVRCLNVRESAVLMGFPSNWELPKGQRVGVLAVGNAIPPPLAKSILQAASAHSESSNAAEGEGDCVHADVSEDEQAAPAQGCCEAGEACVGDSDSVYNSDDEDGPLVMR